MVMGFVGTFEQCPYNIHRYTANVCRDLRGLYREIRVQGFQICRDCGLPAIPVKKLMKNNNKCREYIATGILRGFPYNLYRVCSNIVPTLNIVFHQEFLQGKVCRCCEEFEA